MLLDYDGPDELDNQNPVNGDHEHDSPIREFYPPEEAEELDENPESGETESSMSWPLRSIGSDWSYFSGYTGDLDDTSDSSDIELSSLSSYVETIPDVAVDMSTSDPVEVNANQEVRDDQDVASVADAEAAVEANVIEEVRGAQCVAFRMDLDASLSDSDRTYVSSGEEYPPHKSTSASTTDGVPAGKTVKLYVADGDAGPSGIATIKKEVSDADAGPSGLQAGYASDHTYISSGEEYPPHESCTCGCWPEAQEAKKKQDEMDKVTSDLTNTQVGERGIKRKEIAPDASTSASTTEGVPAGKRVKLYVADGDASPSDIAFIKKEVSDAEAGPSGIAVIKQEVSDAEAGPSGIAFIKKEVSDAEAGPSGISFIKKEVSDANAGPSGTKEHVSDANAGPSGLQAGYDSDDTYTSSGEENSPRGICYCGPCRIERQEAKKKQEELDKLTADLMNTQIGERGIKRKQKIAPDASTSASTTDGVPAGKRVKLYVADGDAGPSGIATIKKEVSDADAGPSALQAGYASDHTYISSGEEYPPHESCTCGCWPEAQEAKKKQEAMNKVTSELMNTQIGKRGIKRKLEDAPDASTSASTNETQHQLHVEDDDAIGIEMEQVPGAEAGPSGLQWREGSVAYDADLTSGIENSPRASDAHAVQSLSTSKDTEPEPARKSRNRRRCKRSRRRRAHRDQDLDSTVSEADTP